jgi:tripartite-type tricarboxylate transporter receptor subunit TctC
MARIAFQIKVLAFVLLVAIVGMETAWPAEPSWPAKDITFIVPFRPGGGFDIQARILAPFVAKQLPGKVNVVIKNVSGAGGKTGIMEIARSKPDGYTLGTVGLESVAFMRAMGDLDLDIKEWSWLGQISSDPLMDIRFGVTSEMLPSAVVMGQALGMKVRPVLFDGSGDAILALMRGDLDTVTFSWPTMSKGVRDSAGKLSGLFVASKSRIPAVKDVPTLGELGVQLSPTASSVLATSRVVVGPAKLDESLRETLENAMAKAMKDPEFLQQMDKAQQWAGYEKGETVKTDIGSAVEAYASVKAQVEPFLKR